VTVYSDIIIIIIIIIIIGARGSVVGCGTVLHAGRSRLLFLMSSLDINIEFNPSSRTVTLGSNQPLTEMRTRNLPGGKEGPARKADLTAMCEPIF
jgi:hypothetical protein